ncbi:MAG: hypothetical protein ABIG96_00015 [Candidatus Micrarchaeota archaeon]
MEIDVWKWAINVVAPGLFKIDIPGYVLGKGSPIGPMAVRNVFIPESFFLKLEKEVGDKVPDGKEKLYALGKKFGYRFSVLNGFPRNDPAISAGIIFKFFETLYAEKISVETDVGKKTMRLKTDGMAITRRGGGGLMVTVGGAAGIWAYLLNDYTMECAVKNGLGCEYEFVAGPVEILATDIGTVLRCDELPEFKDHGTYVRMNSPPQAIPPAAFNMQKLMQTGLFTYKEGELRFAISETRFVPVEIYLLYETERLFPEELVFGAAKESFMEIGKLVKQQKEPVNFISQMLGAFGFGITQVEGEVEKAITFKGYPWMDTDLQRANYALVRGAIEGFLEGNTGRKFSTSKAKVKASGNLFYLSIQVMAPHE